MPGLWIHSPSNTFRKDSSSYYLSTPLVSAALMKASASS